MRKNGFTSVEIAVVTLLVGILASLGSVAVMRTVDKSRAKKTEAELDILATSVLQLAWDTGRWPNGQLRNNGGSREMWDISVSYCGLMNSDGSYEDWQGPYYEGPTVDPWGNAYFFDPDYRVADGTIRAVVGSFGPNGVGPNMYDDDDVYVLVDD